MAEHKITIMYLGKGEANFPFSDGDQVLIDDEAIFVSKIIGQTIPVISTEQVKQVLHQVLPVIEDEDCESVEYDSFSETEKDVSVRNEFLRRTILKRLNL